MKNDITSSNQYKTYDSDDWDTFSISRETTVVED